MSANPKDPKEVIEMRESLAEFGRTVRKAKESYRNLPRIVRKQASESAVRDDETTKKIASAG